MNTIGRLKSLSLVEAGDDNEWKLDIRIRKDRMYFEDMESAVALQGDTVNIVLTEGFDPDNESPRQKKNREEREKYDGVMAEKKRREAESAALPLDGAAPEPTGDGITLPPVEIIKDPDWLDTNGNRYLVEEDIEPGEYGDRLYWEHRIQPVNDEADLSGIEMDTTLYPSPEAARAALKAWAGDNRGYTAVPPEGYGTVYGLPGALYRVAEHEEEEEGYPVFAGFLCKEDGTEARPIKDTDAGTTEDAQKLLDEWASEKELPVFGYVLLSSIPVPVEDASPAMIYEDNSQRYHVVGPTEDTGEFMVVVTYDGTENECKVFPRDADQAAVQAKLDEYAKINGWQPVSAIRLIEGGAEAETIPEPDQSHTLSGLAEQEAANITQANPEPQATQDAPLSYSIKEGDWIARKPSAASRGGLDPKPHQVLSLDQAEKSCRVADIGTVFFAELDEKWELAEAPASPAVDAESCEEDGPYEPPSDEEQS